MRRLIQGGALGAVILLSGLQLDRGFGPGPASGEPAARRADAATLSGPEVPSLTTGDLRAFLQRNRIPHQHLDLRALVEQVNQVSARQRLDPAMVLAVIRVESTFQPDAISRKGALGLMQILPGTGEELASEMGLAWEGDHQLLEPDLNIELGAYYLRKLLDRFDGDRDSALEAYNLGPNRLATSQDLDRAIPFVYARRVVPYWDQFN